MHCNKEISYGLIPTSLDPDCDGVCYECLSPEARKMFDRFEAELSKPTGLRTVSSNGLSDAECQRDFYKKECIRLEAENKQLRAGLRHAVEICIDDCWPYDLPQELVRILRDALGDDKEREG